MFDVSPNIDRFRRIMIKREAALVFRNGVRKIRRTEDNSILTQMILIPRKGVIIQRVSAIHFFRIVRIQQVKHQKNVIHILFIENGEIMRPFFIREQISNGVKDVNSFTYL